MVAGAPGTADVLQGRSRAGLRTIPLAVPFGFLFQNGLPPVFRQTVGNLSLKRKQVIELVITGIVCLALGALVAWLAARSRWAAELASTNAHLEQSKSTVSGLQNQVVTLTD